MWGRIAIPRKLDKDRRRHVAIPRKLDNDFPQLTTDQKKAIGEGLPYPGSWTKIFFS